MERGSKFQFKRKIYKDLLTWKQYYSHDYGLLIEGARRVGKSTIVEQFAKNEYRSYIIVDFDKVGNPVKEIFQDGFDDLDTLFNRLSVYYNTPLYPRNSLIVFDEVQKFPRIHEGMKYLIEDGRYDFVETGSLITLKLLGKRFTNPSEVMNIRMNPMDFEEFLWANGDLVTYPFLRDRLEKRIPLTYPVHRKILATFRTYMCVGGMPEAVNQYLNDKVNFTKVDTAKRSINKLYEDDLRKYDRDYRTFTSAAYSHIPAYLSNKNKTFRYNQIKNGAEYISLINTIEGIEKSLVGNICRNISNPEIALGLSVIPEQIKIYSSDTGLLVTQALDSEGQTSDDIYKSLIFDRLSTNNGMFFENAVAQALTSSGHKLYYHTFKKSRDDVKKQYKIDFVIIKNGEICPIEVKSSSYSRHTSLDLFSQKYKGRGIGEKYIIYSKDFKKEGDTLYLPIYMAGLI